MALLEQLLAGLVQTAAGEHQKVQRSPTDKHPNCLILSYPQAWLRSLSAQLYQQSLLARRLQQTHGTGLTDGQAGSSATQRTAAPCLGTTSVQRKDWEGSLGQCCSDPGTVGRVFASTTFQ